MDFLSGLINRAGKGIDYVVPGDQSRLWKPQPQAPRPAPAPARRPAPQAPLRVVGTAAPRLPQRSFIQQVGDVTGRINDATLGTAARLGNDFIVKPVTDVTSSMGKAYGDAFGGGIDAQLAASNQAMKNLAVAKQSGNKQLYQAALKEAVAITGQAAQYNNQAVPNVDPVKQAANFVNLGLTAATAGGGMTLLRSGINNTLKGNVLRGVAENAPIGAAFGATQAFIDNGSNTTAKNAVESGAVGAALGGALGAAFPLASRGIQRVAQGKNPLPVKEAVQATKKQLTTPTDSSLLSQQIKQYQRAFDVETNPVRKRQISEGIAQLNNQRMSIAQGGYIAGPNAKGFADAQKKGLVFDGVDGKPRFEVDDSKSRITDDYFDERQLQEVLDHPDLYKQYPDLRNLTIREGKDLKPGSAKYTEATDTIEVASDHLRNPEKLRSSVLHEVQHAIQKRESFAKGGSKMTTVHDLKQKAKDAYPLFRARNEKYKADRQELAYRLEYGSDDYKVAFRKLEREFNNDPAVKAANDIQEQIARKQLTGEGYNDYRNLAGEAEARAVQSRMNMTPEERYVKEKQFYHGSSAADKIRVEGFKKMPPQSTPAFGDGIYLANRERNARAYAPTPEGVVKSSIPENLKLYKTTDAEAYSLNTKKLIEEGYDGVELSDGFNTQVTVFDPAKIKVGKAGKRSTFYDSLDVPKEDLIIRGDKTNSINSLDDINKKYPDVELSVYEGASEISLSKIVVPKNSRSGGTGSKVMEDVISYADKVGKRVVLTPSKDYGGSVSRLKDFYKRFGFVENKGRNKDFTTREAMYRDPKNNVAMSIEDAQRYAAETNKADDIINDTTDFLYKQSKETKGGQMLRTENADGYGQDQFRRITENDAFYSDFYKQFKRAPTKADYKAEVKKQLEAGGGNLVEKDMADAYALVKERESVPLPEVPANTAKATPKKVLPQAQTLAPSVKKSLPVSNTTSTVKLNTKRIPLTDEATARLDSETTEIINTLSNKEVKELAKAAGADMKNYDVTRTRKKIAEQLNLRNEIGTLEARIAEAKSSGAPSDEIAKLMAQSAEMGRVSRSQGTDLGRQLQARRIIADQLATPQQRLFRLFDEAGIEPEVYTKRMADVDLSNADEVMAAYRDLVPAKFTDWLDKYRYTNMLSSPLTHIVNITSNIGGIGGVAPVQKLYEGAVDATVSALTGRARTRYASEAGSYYKGVAQAVPDALKKFSDVMTGKQMMETPDADALKYGRLANSGALGVADSVFSFIPKLLEASDQLGMTLTRGGEMASLQKRQLKGTAIPKDALGAADDNAKYRVFRQELNKQGQGHLLGAVDAIPNAILGMRSSKNPAVSTIAKFTIPFVTTPVNLFKQGIEYSPAGVLTLAGNADKTGQAAKALMGTTAVSMAAAAFAANDSITFSEPADAKQRDAFRAEGKQPYAIKIGDKWVGYSKLHPAIAFNLASVGAAKEAFDKGAIDESQMNKFLSIAGGVMGYYRDQSFMKSVGDFTAGLEMKDGADLQSTVVSSASNWSNQLVPFKSMASWIGRMIDPTQRKTDTKADALTQYYQNLVKDNPLLNSSVPVRENPYYPDTKVPIKNDNPILNSFSPLRITNDKGYGNTTGLNITERREMAQLPDSERNSFRLNAINEKYLEKKAKEEKENGTTTTKSAIKPNKTYKTYDDFEKLTTDDRTKVFNQQPDAEYNYEKAKYDKAVKEGTYSTAQRIRAEYSLRKLEAGAEFEKPVRDLYSLTKTQLYDFVSNDPKGKEWAEKVVAYGDKLTEAGVFEYNKFRLKDGTVSIQPKTASKSSGSGRRTASTGRKSTGGRASKGVTSVPATSDTARISQAGSINRKIATAKVSKKSLPTKFSAPKGIKAYAKVKKTNVSVKRRQLA